MTQNAKKVLASNVRSARLRLSISQEELAERSGLHRTYIGGIERAERNISLASLEKLAIALQQTLAQMLTPSDTDG